MSAAHLIETGNRFGNLTVINRVKKSGHTRWECRCLCGQTAFLKPHNLIRQKFIKCPCLAAMKASGVFAVKHGCKRGHRGTSEYTAWSGMISRCHTKTNKAYRWYGAKGISVCPSWRTSFSQFLSDMGAKPSPAHSIDRINNNGNYEPGNCRWATRSQQQNNTSRNRVMILNGVSMTLAQWAEKLGIRRNTISQRLYCGWTEERALTTT